MDDNTKRVMFSSAKEEWGTPQNLFDNLNKEFNFTLDVCALEENHKCDNYFTPETDGLSQQWIGSCWQNPPYGKTISQWIEKAYLESLHGTRTVCLIPARTDTKYFHEYCMKASEIRFVKGRLKFGDATNSAPFPSIIVVFEPYNKPFPDIYTYDPNNPFYNVYRALPIYFSAVEPFTFG